MTAVFIFLGFIALAFIFMGLTDGGKGTGSSYL